MTRWKVFKLTDGEPPAMYAHVGEIDGRYSYSAPDAQKLGETFGAGSFILLEIDPVGATKYVETTIVAGPPTFEEHKPEQVEAVTA